MKVVDNKFFLGVKKRKEKKTDKSALEAFPFPSAQICLFLNKKSSCFCVSNQATIAERANAFRQQCELAETMKLKEINLYDSF